MQTWVADCWVRWAVAGAVSVGAGTVWLRGYQRHLPAAGSWATQGVGGMALVISLWLQWMGSAKIIPFNYIYSLQVIFCCSTNLYHSGKFLQTSKYSPVVRIAYVGLVNAFAEVQPFSLNRINQFAYAVVCIPAVIVSNCSAVRLVDFSVFLCTVLPNDFGIYLY